MAQWSARRAHNSQVTSFDSGHSYLFTISLPGTPHPGRGEALPSVVRCRPICSPAGAQQACYFSKQHTAVQLGTPRGAQMNLPPHAALPPFVYADSRAVGDCGAEVASAAWPIPVGGVVRFPSQLPSLRWYIVRAEVRWPSGLRRYVQVVVSSGAWVRTPPSPFSFTCVWDWWQGFGSGLCRRSTFMHLNAAAMELEESFLPCKPPPPGFEPGSPG